MRNALIAQKIAGKLVAIVIALLALAFPTGAQGDPSLSINLSGYEFLLGTSCTIAY